MSEEQKSLGLSLTINADDFDGKYVNTFQVFTSGQEARVDAIFMDRANLTHDDESGSTIAQAKVVARLNMNMESLISLKQMLDDHFEKIGIEQ